MGKTKNRFAGKNPSKNEQEIQAKAKLLSEARKQEKLAEKSIQVPDPELTIEIPSNSVLGHKIGTSSSELESPLVKKSTKTIYDFRASRTRNLEKQFGSKILNEITLLNSGNCLVKNVTFQFKKPDNKEPEKLFLTLDYEVSTKKGPLSDLCLKHETELKPMQFQREKFEIQQNNLVTNWRISDRKIVTKYNPVPPLPASLSRSVFNISNPAQISHLLLLFPSLLMTLFFSKLLRKN